jgi:hypothetical protein
MAQTARRSSWRGYEHAFKRLTTEDSCKPVGKTSARNPSSLRGPAPTSPSSRGCCIAAVPWVRPCLSGGCSSHRRPDDDRREKAHPHGTTAVPCSHSVGIAGHGGAGIAPAKACRCCHSVTRRSESLSCGHDTTSSTVATHEPYLYWVKRENPHHV